MTTILPTVSKLTRFDVLKFRLLTEGVYLDESARQAWSCRFGGPITLAEYATTSGVSLMLPGSRYVNAPLANSPGVTSSRLSYSSGRFLIVRAQDHIPVRVIPVAKFHEDLITDRYDGLSRPMSSYGVTHTDRCRVSPIAGCAWSCHFCDLPYLLQYRKKHIENLLEVIQAAMADPIAPARHVLISGGTPRGGIGRGSDHEWIDETYETLAKRSPLPVDVMMAPRRDLHHPERLVKAGVQSLSVNLEISDAGRARIITPQKATYGRSSFFKYIERAVEAFGVGYVQSLVVVGSAVEPLESTLQGVRDLVDRGCVPVLSPFRAHSATPMRTASSASYDEVVTAYNETLDICEKANTGVLPGPRCVACHHNVIALPTSSLFYSFPIYSKPGTLCRV